jgi:hypothetical protein
MVYQSCHSELILPLFSKKDKNFRRSVLITGEPVELVGQIVMVICVRVHGRSQTGLCPTLTKKFGTLSFPYPPFFFLLKLAPDSIGPIRQT